MTNEKIREAIEIMKLIKKFIYPPDDKDNRINNSFDILIDIAEKYIILVEAIKTHLLGEGQCGSITKTE